MSVFSNPCKTETVVSPVREFSEEDQVQTWAKARRVSIADMEGDLETLKDIRMKMK
jgi:hypothetical protein